MFFTQQISIIPEKEITSRKNILKTLFTDINCIYGILEKGVDSLAGKEMNSVKTIHHAYLAVVDGNIEGFGEMVNLNVANFETFEIHSLHGFDILPAFVDSHTHIVFAEPRSEEWEMRIKGKSYEEIAAAGGGILNSADKLRNKEEDLLYEDAYARLHEVINTGTGAIEIKSGYGLNLDAEIKMLKVIKRLKAISPIPIKATFLGAHAIPREYSSDRDGYINLIIKEMLPKISNEKLADFVDVFCDKGFFTPAETEVILSAASGYGLRPKIHANELGITGGVQVGVKMKALSVDHLEHCGQEEIDCLRNSNTMPVGLPGTSFFLGIPYTPARRIIDNGLPFALASDYNPGSSPSGNMQLVWSLACTQMKLTPAEGFNALTINAAKALDMQNEVGSVTIGKRANFIITQKLPSLSAIPYYFGRNLVHQMMLNGIIQ